MGMLSDEAAMEAAAAGQPERDPDPRRPRPGAGRPDRRRSPRQTLVAKAVIRPDLSAGMIAPSSVSAGFVSNISMNGVGFHTRRPLAVGEKYRITLEVGPMKWSTRLRIVCCQEHDSGTYDVGAEFIGNELAARSLAA